MNTSNSNIRNDEIPSPKNFNSFRTQILNALKYVEPKLKSANVSCDILMRKASKTPKPGNIQVLIRLSSIEMKKVFNSAEWFGILKNTLLSANVIGLNDTRSYRKCITITHLDHDYVK
ncbi:unnamed protein product [Trichobilharzia szidati]|nr:unnamed protein product [Trichobilharzia szidati]